ncbi:hypothetical protein LTR56_027604 [Elasticomyces elasticus]|nr:hypothetical protein LTR22_027996 [Elasticomyces elasticus]KAK3613899.1 hypothetical protein LTR56_027604 [Elasticomyces elasticus]KAK4899580.1 hypothetical protein LTR49_027631 [Elasticomyces elasticus]KAK5732005.1 hypothetical protein LTS12_027184 [Elasticomyces elasticus]
MAANIVHCTPCAKKGIDCVGQQGGRGRACEDCQETRTKCEPLPQIAHVAYSLWTRSSNQNAEEAHENLKRVLKGWKCLLPLAKDGLLSGPVSGEMNTSVESQVLIQNQTNTVVPIGVRIGNRRANP